MRIQLDTSSLNVLQAQMRGLADGKIKAAAVAALNDAAYVAAEAVKKEMNRVFDRPTPWVMGGVQYIKAGLAGKNVRVPGAKDAGGKALYTKLSADRLEARVDFDKWGNKAGVTVEQVLKAEIYGGRRGLKRHEVALQGAGILPSGMAIVPGPAAERDEYGNMKAAQIVQIMSWFKAFGERGYKANMTDKTRERRAKDNLKTGQRGTVYFALQAPRGKLSPGIYKRVAFGFGSAVQAVMYFVPMPSYKRRLDFYGLAERLGRAEFQRAFPVYLNQMLKERGL